MNSLNRQETEDLIVDLYYNQKKTFRQIQQIVRKSPRDIKVILNKAQPERSSLSIPAQAYRLFSEGKTPIEVAIMLNIREPEATQFNSEYWKLSQLGSLTQIYRENNGNISPLAELHRKMKAAGISVRQVINLLLMANNDLRSIERKCQDLKREAAEITAKNLDAVRTFQRLGNDISEEYRILDKRRSSCREERLELARLRLQREKIQLIVKQFHNDNEDFRGINELVKKAVEQSLANYRYLLNIVFFSIIDSCRSDPIKFSILYHNLPATTRTNETQIFLSNQRNHYSCQSSADKQLVNKYNNNDAYYKILLDEADQFFNERVEELTQVCISQLAESSISASMSSQFDRKSYLKSEDVSTLPKYEIEKKDALQ